MIDWGSVITQLGGTAAMLAVFGYVASKAFESFMAARGEDFKAKLLREAEDHRANLGRTNHEHSVRFASLHGEQAAVIKEVYRLSLKISQSITLLSTAFGIDDDVVVQQALLELESATNELHDYLPVHQIYLPEAIARALTRILNTGFGALLLESLENEPPLATMMLGTQDQRAKARVIIGYHSSQLDEVISDLEREFRKLLGIPVEARPHSSG